MQDSDDDNMAAAMLASANLKKQSSQSHCCLHSSSRYTAMISETETSAAVVTNIKSVRKRAAAATTNIASEATVDAVVWAPADPDRENSGVIKKIERSTARKIERHNITNGTRRWFDILLVLLSRDNEQEILEKSANENPPLPLPPAAVAPPTSENTASSTLPISIETPKLNQT